MSTQVQLRGGTSAEHASFVGAERELTIDTTKDTAVIHDGSTTGGFPLLREDLANISGGSFAANVGGTGHTSYNAGDLLVGTGASNLEKTSTSTGAIILPVGTTAERPSPAVVGMFRFNSDESQFEGYNGTEWLPLMTALSLEGDLATQSGVEDLSEGIGSLDLNA